MINLSTACVLIALVAIVVGEWMLLTWYSRRIRARPQAAPRSWLTGSVLLVCAVGLLVIAAPEAFGFGDSYTVIVFWVCVALLAELPVMLVLVRWWPEGVKWGIERSTLNPPLPIVAASLAAGFILAGVLAAAIAIVPGLQP